MVCALPIKAISISFEEVDRRFGINSDLTDLQKKSEWKKNYKGKCVKWLGQLVYLDEDWFGGFNLGFKHKRDTFTYDVLVSTPSSYEEKLITMKNGNWYSYTIKLDDYAGVIMPITGHIGKCD